MPIDAVNRQGDIVLNDYQMRSSYKGRTQIYFFLNSKYATVN